MKTMPIVAVALCALMFVSDGRADDAAPDGKVVRKITWNDVPLPKGTSLTKSAIHGSDTALVVEHGEAKPVQYALLSLENPGIHAKAYALRTTMRFTDVAGAGYLEMWNVFSPEEAGKEDVRAFSRTLGPAGLMGRITGTSDWREVILPFDSTGAKGEPKKLEVNLFLPGKGRVEIADLELVEFADAKEMFASLEHATNRMLAPPARPEPFLPAPKTPAERPLSSMVAWATIGLALLGGIGIAMKRRRDAEQRRMRALDAM